MRIPSAVRTLMRRQDGVISRSQAAGLGISPARSAYWRRQGDWFAIFPGVFRSADLVVTPRTRIRAAGLWGGDQARVGGQAAAFWLGWVDHPPTVIELVVPRSRFLVSPEGIVTRRTDLLEPDLRRHDSLSITGAEYTALTAAVAMGKDGPAMLDRALQIRALALPLLEEALQRYPHARWHRQAAALVEAARHGEAESERLFVQLLTKAGITEWEQQVRLAVAGRRQRPDFIFRKQRLAVEIDGWAWHHRPDRFQNDRSKGNALLLAGWRVLHFTWYDLTQRPDHVIAQVRAAISV